MLDTLIAIVEGWILGAFGAEAAVYFRAHPEAYTAGGGATGFIFGLGALYLAWRRARRLGYAVAGRYHSALRSLRLLRHRSGRRCLALSAEIRRSGQRLRRATDRAIADRDERRSLIALLENFARDDLEYAQEQMHTWLSLGGGRRVKALQGELERRTARWNVAEGEGRAVLEEKVARTRQQLALARRARKDRAGLLEGLEEAAAAIRTLEAELMALGSARGQALPEFQTQLTELADGFRHQRKTHQEFQTRPRRP